MGNEIQQIKEAREEDYTDKVNDRIAKGIENVYAERDQMGGSRSKSNSEYSKYMKLKSKYLALKNRK